MKISQVEWRQRDAIINSIMDELRAVGSEFIGDPHELNAWCNEHMRHWINISSDGLELLRTYFARGLMPNSDLLLVDTALTDQ